MLVWILIAAAALLLLGYSYTNTFRPVLREVDVEFAYATGPRELRILQLSDLHMERQSISPERLFRILKPTEPDMVVLTGDYLERFDNIDRFLSYLDAVKKLQPPKGIYLVFGNHDHYLGDRIEEFQAAIEAFGGITVMRNESLTMNIDGAKVNIIGIDDYCLGKSDIHRSYQMVSEDGMNLVLAHDPNIVLDMQEEHRADYIFSGHLHGGQFNLIPYFHRLFPMGELPKSDVLKGLHNINGRTIYISEGLGQSGLNVRFKSRPEITMHRLHTSTQIA